MKTTNEVTACVVDSDAALFLPLALKLAQSYKRVLYVCGGPEGFPTINRQIVGDGFPLIEKAHDVWEVKNEVDLLCFPDIQQSGLQLELERQGFSVWGSRAADSIELNREKFLKLLASLELPAPEYEIVRGVSRLKSWLRDKEDKFVKISLYRGTMETFHWRDWNQDQFTLDELAVRFGPTKELIPFIVVDPINSPVEMGCDTYCVDGQWPDFVLKGIEHKDRSYLASVESITDLPAEMLTVLTALQFFFRDHRYRNEWSMELRNGVLIDPTCRGGMPSTGSQSEIWSNFADIIWHGANGEMVQPEPNAKFAAECALTTKADADEWIILDVPKELQQWVKINSACQIDGRICVPPRPRRPDEIGWLVATGDTIEQTIQTILDSAKLLPEGVNADTHSLGELLKTIQEAEKDGVAVDFGKLPRPEIVMEE